MYQHLSNIAIDELGESLIDRFYTEHPNFKASDDDLPWKKKTAVTS